MIDHFQQLAHDPNCPDRSDVLLDLSEETTIPKSRELQVVTGEITRVRERVQFEDCAIVAPRDALYGVLRVFEIFSEKVFREVLVFRSLPEAEAWLAAQREAGKRQFRQTSRTLGGPT